MNKKNKEETMGQRIRARRKEMNFSQEELAAMLYIKKETIYKYEKDLRDMPSSVLAEMSKILKVSPEYLLFGFDDDDKWIEDMIYILLQIKDCSLRDIAKSQMKALADIHSWEK